MEPMRKDLLIRGEQIYLRPITADDTELAVRWRNKPTVVKNFIYRKPGGPRKVACGKSFQGTGTSVCYMHK